MSEDDQKRFDEARDALERDETSSEMNAKVDDMSKEINAVNDKSKVGWGGDSVGGSLFPPFSTTVAALCVVCGKEKSLKTLSQEM